jgi:hypothetical protein
MHVLSVVSAGDGRQAIGGREMNDVEPIEQLIRKGAAGNSLEERHGGAGDQPDSVRGPTRELESGEYIDQHVLNGRGHLLDSVDQQAAPRRTLKDTAAVLPQRLRFDWKIASLEMQERAMRSPSGLMNAPSNRFHLSCRRRRDEEPRRTSARDVLVRSGGQRAGVVFVASCGHRGDSL